MTNLVKAFIFVYKVQHTLVGRLLQASSLIGRTENFWTINQNPKLAKDFHSGIKIGWQPYEMIMAINAPIVSGDWVIEKNSINGLPWSIQVQKHTDLTKYLKVIAGSDTEWVDNICYQKIDDRALLQIPLWYLDQWAKKDGIQKEVMLLIETSSDGTDYDIKLDNYGCVMPQETRHSFNRKELFEATFWAMLETTDENEENTKKRHAKWFEERYPDV